MIDTTGSMGDEIDYLKVEVRDIAARIAADFPNVAQRWALIVYRDDGDEYVVRSFDFDRFADDVPVAAGRAVGGRRRRLPGGARRRRWPS